MRKQFRLPLKMPVYIKRMFARDVIKTIIERTESGVDVNGRSFARYSEAYKSAQIFKDMGKNDNVNLRLFGDMKEALTFHVNVAGVEISFADMQEAAKAHGHNFGGGNLPRREWLWLSQDEETKLLAQYERLMNRVLNDDATLALIDKYDIKTPDTDQPTPGAFGVDIETFER